MGNAVHVAVDKQQEASEKITSSSQVNWIEPETGP